MKTILKLNLKKNFLNEVKSTKSKMINYTKPENLNNAINGIKFETFLCLLCNFLNAQVEDVQFVKFIFPN